MTASVQLAPNEGLLPGDALHVETSDWNQNNLWSADKKNRLELQKDGNIVIYRGKAVWASNTVGIPAVQLVMRTDGNLVALDVTGKQVLWQTHTDGHPGAYCVLQNDSNFVVYDKGAFQNPKGLVPGSKPRPHTSARIRRIRACSNSGVLSGSKVTNRTPSKRVKPL